jgi:hypothetical protein
MGVEDIQWICFEIKDGDHACFTQPLEPFE